MFEFLKNSCQRKTAYKKIKFRIHTKTFFNNFGVLNKNINAMKVNEFKIKEDKVVLSVHFDKNNFNENILRWEHKTNQEILLFRYKIKHLETINSVKGKKDVDAFEMECFQRLFGRFDYVQSTFTHQLLRNFFKSELSFIECNYTTLGIKQKNIVNSYKEYLDQMSVKYKYVDNLEQHQGIEWQSLKEVLAGRMNTELISIRNVEPCIATLFDFLDLIHAEEIKTDTEIGNKQSFIDSKIKIILDNKIMDPIQLDDFPKIKVSYLKLLKVWLYNQIGNRKFIFKDKHQIPKAYTLILEFIKLIDNELKRLVQKSKKSKNKGILSKSRTIADAKPQAIQTEKYQNSDYPRHIFSDAKDFHFFNTLVKKATRPIQISFVFRMMSEKETPFKILVNDTQFRNWFNLTAHEVKLEQHTNTLANSTNVDRTWYYETVKQLIYND